MIVPYITVPSRILKLLNKTIHVETCVNYLPVILLELRSKHINRDLAIMIWVN